MNDKKQIEKKIIIELRDNLMHLININKKKKDDLVRRLATIASFQTRIAELVMYQSIVDEKGTPNYELLDAWMKIRNHQYEEQGRKDKDKTFTLTDIWNEIIKDINVIIEDMIKEGLINSAGDVEYKPSKELEFVHTPKKWIY